MKYKTPISVIILVSVGSVCMPNAQAFSGGGKYKRVSNDDEIINLKRSQQFGFDGKSKKPQWDKTASDLLALVEEFQNFEKQENTNAGKPGLFKSSNKFLLLDGDNVLVDAVASGEPNDLVNDLNRLGAQNAVLFGRIVSCRLPISSIPLLNRLSSLKFVRPAYAGANFVTPEF